MRAISERYAKAMRTASKPVAWFEVLRDDVVLLSSRTAPGGLRVIEGDVVMDRSATHRRSVDITLADPQRTYLPSSASSYLHPLSGNELRVYRGIQFPDDTIESYTQGVFGMASCTITDSVDGYQMHITGLDRSKRCSRSVLVRPYTIAANTNTVTAIQNLVTLALGFTPVYLVTATSYVVNYTAYEIGTDPWEAVTSLAESIGYEVFFNCDGACVIQPQPDPSITPPSYTYAAGQIVVMDNIDRTLTNEESYNGVLTFGHSPYNVSPAFGEAWDTDPASPTYSGFNPATGTFVAPSRYGRVPKIMDSNPNIRTTAQAMAAASAELLRLLGTSEIIEFDAFVNPAHEESDVIGVVRTQAGINASYILDRFNIPLTIDSGMSARTRERRA